MSGVIDENGQQWEHCNECGKWVKIQNLRYEQPTHQHEYGRDLCQSCFVKQQRRLKVANGCWRNHWSTRVAK